MPTGTETTIMFSVFLIAGFVTDGTNAYGHRNYTCRHKLSLSLSPTEPMPTGTETWTVFQLLLARLMSPTEPISTGTETHLVSFESTRIESSTEPMPTGTET